MLQKATDAYRLLMPPRTVIAVTAPLLLALAPVTEAWAIDCPSSDRAGARESAKAKVAAVPRKSPAVRPRRRYILM